MVFLNENFLYKRILNWVGCVGLTIGVSLGITGGGDANNNSLIFSVIVFIIGGLMSGRCN
ncbi:hypothetical protein JoomaDRAFT_1099 [Galbibacter orientalis DSM 19592]|uniref:Uncharacterized protein n=1 Tax=Galbibacter orientalis DSM 19592 TaxID=926559 RepID=I3C3C6_9FLAO|nr:hypothetical protein JoomaDRAFT_1099 [Galbibacter orientalis DSM 19592]